MSTSECQNVKGLVKMFTAKLGLRKYGSTWGVCTLTKRWQVTLCNHLKIKGKSNMEVLREQHRAKILGVYFVRQT